MKTKNTYLFLALLAISFNVFSQKTDEIEEAGDDKVINALLPQEGDFGVSIVVDGLIDKIQLSPPQNKLGNNLLFAKYYFANDKALRLGFGLDINSNKREQLDSVGSNLVSLDSAYNQYFINLSFGYEKHFLNESRLDPYLFSQIDLTFIGKKNTKVNEVTTSNAGERKLDKEIKRDGGFGVGLSAGGGFNYFLAQRFSIGAELAFQLQFVKEGGTISTNETLTPINGNPTVDFESREDLTKNFDVGVRPTARINISYFF